MTPLSEKNSQRIVTWVQIGILLSGIVIVWIFGANTSERIAIFFWVFACFLSGTAIGFLFGIPKIFQNNQALPTSLHDDNYRQQVNTNLTEISDWLTKIIVGLGLVNLIKIPPYLSKVAGLLASGLSRPKDMPVYLPLTFSYGVIISYLILGFLFGYLTTRLYLSGLFHDADTKNALNAVNQKVEEAKSAAKSASDKAEFALINQSVPHGEEVQLLNLEPEGKLNELIDSYNNIREKLVQGNARTNKMNNVIKGIMDLLPSLPTFNVSQMLQEKDNGKRVAAYAYLYVKPEYQFLEELVSTFTTDSIQFGQYWGIQALGKLLNVKPNEEINPTVFKKLKTYYDGLQAEDGKRSDLGKMLPKLQDLKP